MKLYEYKLKVEDIICSDRYLHSFPEYYIKTDHFYNGTLSPHPTLIISGHSDLSVTTSLFEQYRPSTWYSINAESPCVYGLPLGITNYYADQLIFSIYGNKEQMIKVSQLEKDRSKLLYMNFNVHTYPVERIPVQRMFKDRDYVTYEEPEPTLEGRERYLLNLQSHIFTLCPRGNGVDTHRIWEAIYMGCIPIVKNNLVHKDWKDLPILWIDEWDCITEEYLHASYRSMLETDYAFEKIKVQYWIDRIKCGLAGKASL
jgi:hypothetical protein